MQKNLLDLANEPIYMILLLLLLYESCKLYYIIILKKFNNNRSLSVYIEINISTYFGNFLAYLGIYIWPI